MLRTPARLPFRTILPLLAVVATTAFAQSPAPVEWAEAISSRAAAGRELSGTVEARRESLVACEVSGVVTAMAARDGDAVAAGAPIVRIRRETIDLEREGAAAGLREAEARLELARRNLDRAEELHEEGVIPRQQLDDAVGEVDAWRGRVDVLRAQLARSEDDLARSAVVAPFSGVVVAEHTAVGEWLGRGDPVVELVDLDDLEVVVPVPERMIGGIVPGTPATITVDALPGLTIDGETAAIVPRADARARTLPVKVRFDNPGRRVAVGMLATVRFAREGAAAVMVPKDAVVRTPAGTAVYRIVDGSAERVEVTAGAAVGGWVGVDGGIAAGDRVVVRGNERLRPGQPVEGSRAEIARP